ncbi:MAG TPA: hypothetical protein VGM43_00805, partial [Bryobacteraceae bacterium]
MADSEAAQRATRQSPVTLGSPFAAPQPRLEQLFEDEPKPGDEEAQPGAPLASISSPAAHGAVGSRRISTRARICAELLGRG